MQTVKTDNYTIKSGHLDVGDGHKIWYEQWGNSQAKTPILFFHGGPGSGFKPHHKSNFDPRQHQLIGFDQRGCGNSLPYGSIIHNTTQDLLLDAIKLLKYLKINRIYIHGRSWGSTLACLFTIKYPEYVIATLISGIFTATQAEIDYLDKGYFKNHYPEVWEQFVHSVPKSYADNPAEYHYKRIAGTDKKAIETSAKALSDLESPLLQFDWTGYDNSIKPDLDPNKPKEEYDPVPYKIYGHYLQNACFLDPNYIMKNASKIKSPVYIVQGRYDMCCPPVTAYNLHKTIERSKLFMTLGSHGQDPENRIALKTIIETVFI